MSKEERLKQVVTLLDIIREHQQENHCYHSIKTIGEELRERIKK